ncbi:hypothetical protein BDZ97DRAFT_1755928 [Flammula alnicola]|nr:hypothetical protein BDZ97DRAFT_1755928 [Flammula alnicola]
MSYVNPLHGHLQPTQKSGYSAIGGAVPPPGAQPTRYRLNQPIYSPSSKFHAAMGRAGFPDIKFDWTGYNGSGCSVVTLSARSVSGLIDAMKGGADQPFAHRPDLWPGYPHVEWARSIDVTTGGPITRAKLAQAVAQNILRFLEIAGQTRSTQVKDHIGPQGILPNHVFLVSLQNVIENNWQATIVVDMG